MPITEELKNVKRFESVGFTHEQAEALADVVEQAQVNSQEGLKGFISSELGTLRNELTSQIKDIRNELASQIKDIRNELKQDIKDLEVRMAYAQKDMLVKIFGIIVGSLTVAVTILKLFP